DLAPGRLRVKRGGGHAGHNGLRSCHEHIGPHYARVRIGIGHPGDKRLVSGYVLHDFAKADWDWIDPLLEGIADGAPALASEDDAGFMNKVALRRQAAEKPKDAPIPAAQEASPRVRPREKNEESDAREKTPLQRLMDRFGKKD
ncbi:MAG: aminoacyl-tRNA hydrolase, partial [Pseudomonadota bacterium]